jgi:hypothetical protein
VVVKALEAAKANPVKRPVDQRKLLRVPKTYQTKLGAVTIPVEENPALDATSPPSGVAVVTHEEIQWLLLKLGSDMGLDVWVARNDRRRQYAGNILGSVARARKELPQQFDEATNRTIELIDVLWLQGNSIAAAFEVEHTTSIYSGLLRMADLISMQPNIKIRLFIAAPDEKREKVIEEINRPTFSRLSPPLNTVCRFIPYSDLKTRMSQVGELRPTSQARVPPRHFRILRGSALEPPSRHNDILPVLDHHRGHSALTMRRERGATWP